MDNQYIQKIYAGILGKIIGVYLGRPIENWSYQQIKQRFGKIDRFVNQDLNLPLVVTDDDITGTLTFIRAITDFNFPEKLTSDQIGKTWLNYVIYLQSVFWWGGFGNSTEHTAFIRLKEGIIPPATGSQKLNGKVVSEQIGAQIFIDGWAMLAPGDPDKAVHFAEQAARVSHDGEAVYAAVMLAAMESLAFIEQDINQIVDQSISFIPKDSAIYRLINDIRDWHQKFTDWQNTREKIEENYGYDVYKGVVHVVPNHGLIHLGLFYGQNDFKTALMITNSAGWDTDCNSGNVGCFLGIKNGMDSFSGLEDWRALVNDRLFLPTADGGGAITDALRETYHVVNLYRKMSGNETIMPKNEARFNFSLPGSTQAFVAIDHDYQPDSRIVIKNKIHPIHSTDRLLSISFQVKDQNSNLQIVTPTFVTPDEQEMPGYALNASPTLYPGQKICMKLLSDNNNTGSIRIFPLVIYYGENDQLVEEKGDGYILHHGGELDITWSVPVEIAGPIVYCGFSINTGNTLNAEIFLDYLTWKDTPTVTFQKPSFPSKIWKKTWVKTADHFDTFWQESFRIIQNKDTGLVIQGVQDWRNYSVTANITSHLMSSGGLAFCVQGCKRYYALVLSHPGKVQLKKMLYAEKTLLETKYPWKYEETYTLSALIKEHTIIAYINGKELFRYLDQDQPLVQGAVAYICEQGCFSSDYLKVGNFHRNQS